MYIFFFKSKDKHRSLVTDRVSTSDLKDQWLDIYLLSMVKSMVYVQPGFQQVWLVLYPLVCLDAL